MFNTNTILPGCVNLDVKDVTKSDFVLSFLRERKECFFMCVFFIMIILVFFYSVYIVMLLLEMS